MRTAPPLIALLLSLSGSLLGVTKSAAQLPAHPSTPGHQERGNLVLEGIPAADPGLSAHLERYLHARAARFLDWLPDGAMLIATRLGDVEAVHRLAAPLGM